jgi:hypothetical protein
VGPSRPAFRRRRRWRWRPCRWGVAGTFHSACLRLLQRPPSSQPCTAVARWWRSLSMGDTIRTTRTMTSRSSQSDRPMACGWWTECRFHLPARRHLPSRTDTDSIHRHYTSSFTYTFAPTMMQPQSPSRRLALLLGRPRPLRQHHLPASYFCRLFSSCARHATRLAVLPSRSSTSSGTAVGSKRFGSGCQPSA